jgi:hypothetical protein
MRFDSVPEEDEIEIQREVIELPRPEQVGEDRR